jgi:hypothetical protein
MALDRDCGGNHRDAAAQNSGENDQYNGQLDEREPNGDAIAPPRQ